MFFELFKIMDDNDADSAFKLISSLCEKFCSDPDKIKKSRSRCFEILLGKRKPKHRKCNYIIVISQEHNLINILFSVFKDLKGTADPYCNLLSWQLTLIHDYDLKSHADNLQQCAENVQHCYGDNTDTCNNVLQFLLSLRNIPRKGDNLLVNIFVRYVCFCLVNLLILGFSFLASNR